MTITMNSSLQQGHWGTSLQHFKQSILKTCTLILFVHPSKIVGFDHFGYLAAGKSLLYRLNRWMGGSKSRTGRFGGENIFPQLKAHPDSFAAQLLSYRNTDYALLARSLWKVASELEENRKFHNVATLTEVFPCFFLSCKANSRV
jgi:hypothetical protein